MALLCAAAVMLTSVVFGGFGCGDDEAEPEPSPFDGTYRVLRHTRNNADCDEEGDPLQGSDEFFRLAVVDGELTYRKCDSPQECNEDTNSSKGFDIETDEGWSSVRAEFQPLIDYCDSELTERFATLPEGADGGVRIELFRREAEVPQEHLDETCDEDFVLEHRDDLDCTAYELIETTREE